jgi:GH15 family glucan-1,4-alpha-glucosidase
LNNLAYIKAIELLHQVSTPNGFLASVENTSNYKRIWARDGVVCGLAALASNDENLIKSFASTLNTLAKYQHKIGTIPSNVLISDDNIEISYGGLAGRIDAVTWYIIGVCQFAFCMNDFDFFKKHQVNIDKCFTLLESWEFNNKHLIYVPLSGNWADEYITDGYVLYDQLLRIWALKSYNFFAMKNDVEQKIKSITEQIEINFTPNSIEQKYHERAYKEIVFQDFAPCSFSPSGYKLQFDAFANSLMVLLNVGSVSFQNKIIDSSLTIASQTELGLLPAFWPPIFEVDEHWNLLKNNCKYEFRNFPYEFHNGGSWTMVNGFFAMALLSKEKIESANLILQQINQANAKFDYSFYENFNTKTQKPNGVSFCAWSAAASILVHQSIHSNFKLIV